MNTERRMDVIKQMEKRDITENTYENINLAAEAILQKVSQLLEKKTAVILAIDGRCGAGKTTLAQYLSRRENYSVIPMDHFFLPFERRSIERLAAPGGNVDYERFESEVLLPLQKKEAFSYFLYDCKKQMLTEKKEVLPGRITIIEGSYSCHPKLEGYYDLKVFLTVDEREQLRRIEKRNGQEGLVMFREKWIPLEEKYFTFCQTMEKSDMQFDTGDGTGKAVFNQLT